MEKEFRVLSAEELLAAAAERFGDEVAVWAVQCPCCGRVVLGSDEAEHGVTGDFGQK